LKAVRATQRRPSEIRILEGICRNVRARGRITEEDANRLSMAFGSRFERAMKALTERRVKKYVFRPSGRVVWVVVGRHRDYVVMPEAVFCTCDDFYFRFDEGHLCYHIIAQRLAEATNQFDLIEEEDGFYETLMREWRILPSTTPKTREGGANA